MNKFGSSTKRNFQSNKRSEQQPRRQTQRQQQQQPAAMNEELSAIFNPMRTTQAGPSTRAQTTSFQPKQTEPEPTPAPTPRPPRALNEAQTYGFNEHIHNLLNISELKEHYPSLPAGQRHKFTLEGQKIEFCSHAIKIFASNIFRGDKYDNPFDTLIEGFKQVSLLFTRKFARVLDYQIPDMDSDFLSQLANPPRPIDRDFCASKQSEFYLIVDPEDTEFTPAKTFYTTYRSFVPIMDVSKASIDKIAMLKIYYNLLIAEAKCKLKKDEKLNYKNIDGIIQLINFYYEKSVDDEMAHALVKALLFQRITSIGDFLLNHTSFLEYDDLYFFNDEYDGYELWDYVDFMNNFNDRKVKADECDLKNLLLNILKNILDYKKQKITFIEYDAIYRKLLIEYLKNSFGAIFTPAVIPTPAAAPNPAIKEKTKARLIFNTVPEVAFGRKDNLTKKNETELLSLNRATLIEVMADSFQYHERFASVAFPFIKKHFINDTNFINAISNLDYTPTGSTKGTTALINLFKLAAYTGQRSIFAIFEQKNRQYCQAIGKDIYYAIAFNQGELLVDKFFYNIRAVFNQSYPDFINTFLESAKAAYKGQDDKLGLYLRVLNIFEEQTAPLPVVKKDGNKQ